MKIATTTLGETGGDAVSMSMNLGYLVGTLIFTALFLIAVTMQMRAKCIHSLIYWATIIATTMVGTTLADYVDRSLSIGYVGGTALLIVLLIAIIDGLVPHCGINRSQYGESAEGRRFLLDHHHVFADAGNGTG